MTKETKTDQSFEKEWPVDIEKREAEKGAPDVTHPTDRPEALLEQITQLEAKAEGYYERMIRLQAELENTKRRMDTELAKAHKFALEGFLKQFLPIVDSLEQGLEASLEPKQGDNHGLHEGIELTLKMLHELIEKFGIKQINPIGESFNPQFHEALSMQEDTKVAAGTILLVVQRGYTLNDRIIRPARVIVAKAAG